LLKSGFADSGTLLFDYSSNNEMKRKPLPANKISCISSKEKVEIQFTLLGVDQANRDNRDPFLEDVPDSLAVPATARV